MATPTPSLHTPTPTAPITVRYYFSCNAGLAHISPQEESITFDDAAKLAEWLHHATRGTDVTIIVCTVRAMLPAYVPVIKTGDRGQD